MSLKELLSLVEEKWHDAFLHFVQSGEADQEFLDYIDSNESMQKAVEKAFHMQAAPIKGLARKLAKSEENVPRPEVINTAKDMKMTFKKMLGLSDTGKLELKKLVISELDAHEKQEVVELLED